eukprot:scaffold3578_cov112-Isochrysis_galbana.AAC.4
MCSYSASGTAPVLERRRVTDGREGSTVNGVLAEGIGGPPDRTPPRLRPAMSRSSLSAGGTWYVSAALRSSGSRGSAPS